MQASKVMTFGAATIKPEASIREAARTMLESRISGLPVVDDDGNLVGILSEGDLLNGITGNRRRRRWLEFILDPAGWKNASEAKQPQTVGEVMTRHVITATEDTPVPEIIEQMRANNIKRLPVVRGNKVIGIVSRADLIRGLALEAETMPGATAEDYALRDRVLEALAKDAGDRQTSITVLAKSGRVELRGAIPDAGLREKLVSVARQVSGVKELVDHLVVVGRRTK